MLRLIACFAAFASAALAHAASTSTSASAFSSTLQPGQSHESCMSLQDGDQRRYYWKSDAPVDFELSVRSGGEPTSLMKRPRMRGDGGTVVAKTAGEYCWRWSAAKPAKLEGKIESATATK